MPVPVEPVLDDPEPVDPLPALPSGRGIQTIAGVWLYTMYASNASKDATWVLLVT